MTNQALKHKLFVIIFGADTPAGKAFDVSLFVAILISVGLTMLQSVHSIRDTHGGLIVSLNGAFTVLFTIEYILRLYCAKNPAKYARSFFGVVDLLAVLPFYLGLFIDNAEFLNVIKMLRMLRIFRVLKMAQYVGEADILMNSLIASRRKIGIFLVTVLTLVIIVGSMMYAIEGEEHGFSSIPQSVYWAIITVTTVGYGDIAPETPLGQTLAAFLMIIAYSIIAVPTGIITAELGFSAALKVKKKNCPSCKKGPHDHDAQHCKFCGHSLDK